MGNCSNFPEMPASRSSTHISAQKTGKKVWVKSVGIQPKQARSITSIRIVELRGELPGAPISLPYRHRSHHLGRRKTLTGEPPVFV
jgi:hypothetical protein